MAKVVHIKDINDFKRIMSRPELLKLANEKIYSKLRIWINLILKYGGMRSLNVNGRNTVTPLTNYNYLFFTVNKYGVHVCKFFICKRPRFENQLVVM